MSEEIEAAKKEQELIFQQKIEHLRVSSYCYKNNAMHNAYIIIQNIREDMRGGCC